MSATSSTPRSDFWRTTPLEEMTPGEWERLCDGCGRCCLQKLEDADTGEVSYTDIACGQLDIASGRCRCYGERKRFVPDCQHLTAATAREFLWLPSTCAYRLLAEGRELPEWHPLVSGDSRSVERAGISVKGRVIPEHEAGDPLERIVSWPK